jgi:hypothetical protein|tara:strand:- start:215 stop:541 length:327 start_codon:yes stop_codon:yes gene_type:complete
LVEVALEGVGLVKLLLEVVLIQFLIIMVQLLHLPEVAVEQWMKEVVQVLLVDQVVVAVVLLIVIMEVEQVILLQQVLLKVILVDQVVVKVAAEVELVEQILMQQVEQV